MSPHTSALTHCHTAPAIHTLDLSAVNMANLLTFSEGQRPRYLHNSPIPHLVIDRLFPQTLLEAVLAEAQGIKPGMEPGAEPASEPEMAGPTTQRLLMDLCAAQFCEFLERLTGIEGIIPDPYFVGGGLRQDRNGHFVKMGTASGWHPRLKLERCLTVLIYLNLDWQEAWGGHLELWNAQMSDQFVKIPPAFNKTVIFSTPDYAYYGYPNLLSCPTEISRRSLTLYYYSSRQSQPERPFYSSTPSSYAAANYAATNHSAANYSPQTGESLPSPGHSRPSNSRSSNSRPSKGRLSKHPVATRLQQSVGKSLKKSVPKPLLDFYKASKRSLRG